MDTQDHLRRAALHLELAAVGMREAGHDVEADALVRMAMPVPATKRSRLGRAARRCVVRGRMVSPLRTATEAMWERGFAQALP